MITDHFATCTQLVRRDVIRDRGIEIVEEACVHGKSRTLAPPVADRGWKPAPNRERRQPCPYCGSARFIRPGKAAHDVCAGRDRRQRAERRSA